jgi:hypothetical protein
MEAAFRGFKNWMADNGREPDLPGLGMTHEQLFFINMGQV